MIHRPRRRRCYWSYIRRTKTRMYGNSAKFCARVSECAEGGTMATKAWASALLGTGREERGGGKRSADGETWRSARQNRVNLTFDSVAPRMAGWPPVQIGPHDRELYRARTSIFRDKRGNPSYIGNSRKREEGRPTIKWSKAKLKFAQFFYLCLRTNASWKCHRFKTISLTNRYIRYISGND